MSPHGLFHENSDQQSEDKHEPKGFDTSRGVRKQGNDKDRVPGLGKLFLFLRDLCVHPFLAKLIVCVGIDDNCTAGGP